MSTAPAVPPSPRRAALAGDPLIPAAVREGAPLIILSAILGLALLRWRRDAGLAALGVACWVGWFFRDPRRECPAENGVLYAPADGTIRAVDEVEWDWFFHGRALRIVIFLSLFDVHVNRSPAAGRLVAYRRDPGRFAPAFLVPGSADNARQLLGIEVERPSPAERRIVVAQVAGFLARRIVSWRLPGDTLAAGEKLGMIRFGSRTDLLVPAGLAEPLVRPGDAVHAALTPIARYRA